MRRWTLIIPLVLVSACSFPPIAITGESSGSGGATGSSATSTSGSTSSTGGAGGATSSSTSTTSSSSGGCVDADGDHILSWMCDPSNKMLDCADEDPLAHPGADFQPAPIVGATKAGTKPFDFNCDGAETAETGVLTCNGVVLTGCPMGTGFQADVACGVSAPLGKCGTKDGVNCAWVPVNPAQNVTQRCK
jgi:hypothetical protein